MLPQSMLSLNNPLLLFFNPQGSDTHKGLGPQKSRGGGGDKGKLKCLVKAGRAAESSLMLAQTDNLQKFPVKLMSCHFVFNMSLLANGLEAVFPFSIHYSYCRFPASQRTLGNQITSSFCYATAMTFRMFSEIALCILFQFDL